MLHLLIISDGKPGHFKKSAAIADAIANRRPATSAWLDARLRLPVLHDVLRRVLRRHRRLPGPNWLRATHRFPRQPLPAQIPDLIISSGGKTAFANAWLAQLYGCPNVFIGHTRGIHDGYFARIMVFGMSATDDPRRIPSLIPTGVDREALEAAGRDYLEARDAGFAGRKHWTMLIGGDSGGYRYAEEDWRQLTDAMRTLARKHAIRWLVTTSRRTPRRAEQLLLDDRLRDHVDELLIFRLDRRRIFNALLACGDAIFCTEDSGTMLTEAAATGKPVFSLRPRRADPTTALEELLTLYTRRRRLKRSSISQMSGLARDDVTHGFDATPDDELASVCERILEVVVPPRAAA